MFVGYFPCFHGGVCNGTDLSCDCSQAIGYKGDQCEEALGLCETGQLQCLYGGECTEDAYQPSCVCKPGYSGVTCAIHGKS